MDVLFFLVPVVLVAAGYLKPEASPRTPSGLDRGVCTSCPSLGS